MLIFILIIAMVSDIRFQKIPNRLTYPAMLAAFIYHTAINGGGGFLFSAEGLGLGIAVWIVPYLMGGMGAGDVKLMGVVGAFLGPEGVFVASLSTAIVGGVCALALLTFHGHLNEIIKRYGTMLKSFIYAKSLVYLPPPQVEKKPRLYYGIAITLGTLASLFLKYVKDI